jgi:hypothetical protein
MFGVQAGFGIGEIHASYLAGLNAKPTPAWSSLSQDWLHITTRRFGLKWTSCERERQALAITQAE